VDKVIIRKRTIRIIRTYYRSYAYVVKRCIFEHILWVWQYNRL